ncbi:MAG: pyridoxal-phosphate dependent enzyme, partial [Deltaproteobacteria bacterium]|nr:pyridoxal-phosphate dependent enzyme [Deltaproteobacteria bacterium]
QPIAAFKVRGGINLISQLSPEEKKQGVITVSTGNHAQSIAYAARIFGVKATIVMPQKANPGKVAATKGLGAEVILHGESFDEARSRCEELTEEQGLRYVHPANELPLIAGVATETLEMLEKEPDLEAIYVPLGGGSGASGACIVSQAVNPAIRVVAVQSEAAPAGCLSWQKQELVEAPTQTQADGLATTCGFELPQAILGRYLADFVLISDEEIFRAMGWLMARAHTLAEAAGAAPLGAIYRQRSQLAGRKVGFVLTGGNTSFEHLRMALDLVQEG